MSKVALHYSSNLLIFSFMAKKYNIDIDSFLGDWGYSKRYVKNKISEAGSAPVLVRVNSLGGSVDHALDIAAQFEAHGNVTVELFSFNASAATVFPLGAKKVRIHENAMYLIHKVLAWVDKWGMMNEDDIEQVIQDLQKLKNDNEKMTLNLAAMYSKKSGKPIKDILNLMKEEKWLTANEAKEWGFVDEVFSEAKIQTAEINDDLTEKFNAFGLPNPVREIPVPTAQQPATTEDKPSKDIITGVVEGLKEIFNFSSNNKITKAMNKTFTAVMALLAIDAIEFKNGKAEISEDQVKLVNEKLTNLETDKTNLETEKSDLQAKLTDKDTEIANLKAEIDKLNKKPGAETTNVVKDADGTNGSEPENNFAHVASAQKMMDILGEI